MLYSSSFIDKKKILLCPYNNLSLKLKSFLNKSGVDYQFLDFVDSEKVLDCNMKYKVLRPQNILDIDFDCIIVSSPNYFSSISNDLEKIGVEKHKILFASHISCYFIFCRSKQIYSLVQYFNDFFSPKVKLISYFFRLLIKNTWILNVNDKKLKKYRNKYQEQRCFIIGNGPSLTIKDLEKLSGEVTFAANGIFFGLDSTQFRPTYYSVCDPIGMEDLYDSVSNFFDNRTIMLFPKNVLLTTYKVKNALYYDCKPENKTNFDLLEGIYTGNTVSYNLISLAIYMGFKDIYLIGLDFNFTAKQSHFIKNYLNFNNKDAATKEVLTWFDDFKKLNMRIQDKKINIYNATRGGKLDIFPRVDFDQIVKTVDEQS